jgi:CheY-like chemotaxis protein
MLPLCPVNKRRRIRELSLRKDSILAGDMVPIQTTAAQVHVLVVDDVCDNANSLAFLLQGRNCQTSTVYSATDGINAAEQLKPDVIVLDLCMPGLNGIETCRRIRERPWAKETIIVGVTGSWIAQEAAQRGGGFDGVFLKPGEIEPLRRLIVGLTSNKRAAGEAVQTAT